VRWGTPGSTDWWIPVLSVFGGTMSGVTSPPTGLRAYRAVLAVPSLRRLTAVALFVRVPATATAITLTLHVVLRMGLGYAAAGLVVAASTVGMGVGAPLMGRLVDRRDLRTMVGLTLVVAGVFWALAPGLAYPVLLGAACVGGLLATPVHAVIRQSVGVLAPPELRHTAYAVDAIMVDLSYIVGPALGATLALSLPGPWPMWVVGGLWVGAGVALWLLDPAIRHGPVGAEAARAGIAPGLLAALVATFASVYLLIGTELVMVASLQRSGQAVMIPLVNAVWCVASIVGGFAYGALRRPLPLAGLVAGLGAATLPIALAGPWWSLALLLVPAGLLCAPSIAAGAGLVSALAPDHARGFVIGLHTSSLTAGGAAASAFTGALIDRWSPGLAVLVVGALGIAAALLSWVLARGSSQAAVAPPPQSPSAHSQADCGTLGGDEREPGVPA
jgi:MFS family permease